MVELELVNVFTSLYIVILLDEKKMSDQHPRSDNNSVDIQITWDDFLYIGSGDDDHNTNLFY